VPSLPQSKAPPPGDRQNPADSSLPGREQTDESLRTERRTADGTAGDVRVVEEEADRVVDLARDRADAVLTEAREIADRQLRASGCSDSVARDRAQSDELLQDERALADERLRRERADCAETLLSLLPLERETTDRDLLTERARSDAALANRDDFLGIVSHDLNNLLAGIVMSVEILSRNPTPGEEGERIVKGAKRVHLYAARMKRLIGDLMDVTSIAGGKLAVTIAPRDANELVAEALETFRLLAAEKGISLEPRLAIQPMLSRFDRDRILQVLANLIANAIKFTARGGTISACTERIGNETHVSIADTGPGIPKNLLEAVFQRFWQAGENDQRGLGLGLYIAKSIVEAHGGKIWAESRVGEGSTFHFTVPAADTYTH
jgi:signal transduction histidine kinase